MQQVRGLPSAVIRPALWAQLKTCLVGYDAVGTAVGALWGGSCSPDSPGLLVSRPRAGVWVCTLPGLVPKLLVRGGEAGGGLTPYWRRMVSQCLSV